MAIPAVISIGSLGLSGYWTLRWIHHLRSLKSDVCSSWAPLDVQLLRTTDLARQLPHALQEHDAKLTPTIREQLSSIACHRRDSVAILKRASLTPVDDLLVSQASESVGQLSLMLDGLLNTVLVAPVVDGLPIATRERLGELQQELAEASNRYRSVEPMFQRAKQGLESARQSLSGRLAWTVSRRLPGH